MRNLIPHFIHRQFERQVYHGHFQAASLFVDISGFTRLTEHLMQYRKDGAEVLTDVLNDTFQPVIHQVYAHGGFVATFAGDAFTALFPLRRKQAWQHAVQAAVSIQRFFAAQGDIQTRYGNFKLAATIGMGSGPVQWGILGQSHLHAFFFRGPAIDTCAQAQHQAKTGQILLAPHEETPPPEDYLENNHKGHEGHKGSRIFVPGEEQSDHGFYLALTAQPIENAPELKVVPPPPMPLSSMSAFVLDEVIDLSAAGEFRNVASVFISFETPRGDAQLNSFVSQVLEEAFNYGGYFNKLDFGDKGAVMLILFGAPLTHENDVERAGDFLLALQGRSTGVRWRAGLTFGSVYAGIMGSQQRCEYTAIGDVVNLSSRLMARAGWGEIWADSSAFKHLVRGYHLDERGQFEFKGKSAPLPVYSLTGKKTLTEGVLFSGELVGREAELAQLEQFVAQATAGTFAGVAYVHGEPGMGKSRLVYELKQRLSSASSGQSGLNTSVAWFTCPAEGILHQSLYPFRHFLRGYFDQSAEQTADANKTCFNQALDNLIADLQDQGRLKNNQAAPGTSGNLLSDFAGGLERARPFLGALVNLHWEGSVYEQLDPKLRFENILTAFKTLILAETLRQQRPVLLELEDAHLLDSDSQAMLQTLTHNIAGFPLALIAVCRYRDDGSRFSLPLDSQTPQINVDLNTLTTGGVEAIANRVLGGVASEALVTFLAEKSGGNPFFVEQLALDLRERGLVSTQVETRQINLYDPASSTPHEMAELPATINAVLIARLDRLAGKVKQAVQTAAVLGREFEVQVLRRMLNGDSQWQNAIKLAEEEQIWMALNALRYLFKHTLLRDAAYEMQFRTRLQELHLLAAQAIEAIYAADLAPYYADLAYHYDQAEQAQPAARWYRLAGEQAAAQFANSAALNHFKRALELTPPGDAAGHYIILLAREKVYDLQGERKAQAQDLTHLAHLAQRLDAQPEVNRQAWRRAEVALRYAGYAEAVSDYPAALATVQSAIELAQAAGHTGQQAEGYLHWGQALYRQADYAAAHAQLGQALTLAQGAGLRWIEADSLHYLGNVAFFLNEHNQASAHWQQALDIYREMSNRRGEASTLNSLSALAWHQADHSGAIAYWKQALALYREIGDRRGEAKVLTNLGTAFNSLGDYTTTRRYYEESLRIHRDIGDRHGEGRTLASLGLLFHHLGDQFAARQHSQQGLLIAQELGGRNEQGLALNNLARALADLDLLDEAAEVYRQALTLQRDLGQHNEATEPMAGLAQVYMKQHQLGQAQTYVENILTHLQNSSLDGTEEPLRVYLICYQVLQAGSDPRARPLLHTAYTRLHEQASQIGDAALRRSFLENVQAHRQIIQAWEEN